MSGRWRRIEKMPIALNDEPFAVHRYMIAVIDGLGEVPNIYKSATYEEAQAIAARLRTTDAQIVTIARVEDAWKRQ